MDNFSFCFQPVYQCIFCKKYVRKAIPFLSDFNDSLNTLPASCISQLRASNTQFGYLLKIMLHFFNPLECSPLSANQVHLFFLLHPFLLFHLDFSGL